MEYGDKPPVEDLITGAIFDSSYLEHVGVGHLDGGNSGRYAWGSGKNPYQHAGSFLARIDELKSQGLSEKEIADSFDLTIAKYRTQKSLATSEQRAKLVNRAKDLRNQGYSLNEVAKKMGYKNDSSVRSLLNMDSEAKMNQALKTADFLKEQVDKKGMLDVGVGVERELGPISREKMEQALYILELQGYPTYKGGVPQATNPGRQINRQVLCPPGTEHKEIYDFSKVHSVNDYIYDRNIEEFRPKFVYPKSMDSKRMRIRYAEEGGIEKDGLIEIRRNVDDLSLGNSRYAQVRILVDDTHYMKGMAVYKDNMPDGVDVIFNTNKPKGTPKEKVLKAIKNDPENPFGSLIKEGVNDPGDSSVTRGGQSYYIDKNGKKQLSLINKRAEEGDWGEWKDTLSSQFLSKQSKALIDKQLGVAMREKQAEYDDICALTNPTVKKKLLESFANDCDSAAVHLKAAALPRQKYQVIIPIPSLKDTECYAPNFENGEKVALVRYPHGGTFEIPILTVNNKHASSKKVLGTNPSDAIGINSKVAERLSGADFDGDTVMVIPTNDKVKITSKKPLAGLEGFDPKMEYGTVEKDGAYYNQQGKKIKVMRNTQTEMGIVSNLISDMNLKGANNDELARAVRHSMVVIDAEKHKLDYKSSYKDNDIASLKKKYQGSIDPETGKYHEGASTIISRAKSEVQVEKRKGSPRINTPYTASGKPNPWYDPSKPEGSLVYNTVHEEYIDKKGKVQVRTQSSTRMAETHDAYTLVSDLDNPKERAYADYANKMKSLANQARKEMVSTGKIESSKTAKETYRSEVDDLMAQLNVALKNAPREAQAQRMANAKVKALKEDNPDMTKSEIKKANQRALTEARNIVGAKRTTITISDKQWEAIQSGAISETKLIQILNNADLDDIRQKATPRAKTELSPGKISTMEAMRAQGYTNAEIARRLGVSASTVSKYTNGKG